MNITLNNPKIIVLEPEKTLTLTQIVVTRLVDLPAQKQVRAFIEGIQGPIMLWEGDDYTNIGQWTDTDVTNKLNQLYNS